MIYTAEVENMCPVKKGAYHGPAPIPQEGEWTQAKEIRDELLAKGIVLKDTREGVKWSRW